MDPFLGHEQNVATATSLEIVASWCRCHPIALEPKGAFQKGTSVEILFRAIGCFVAALAMSDHDFGSQATVSRSKIVALTGFDSLSIRITGLKQAHNVSWNRSSLGTALVVEQPLWWNSSSRGTALVLEPL
ncbi:hypothetical protein I7I51_00504 [Histoplasma capsulatum]|uniref:Uncharacterized protein n=1 Tax=Ajellomyces capsulatus TaxID=5037 RepID=A0A8A1MAA2_AJECA|nr:hypothetical protein I7I51_00504 [Histoplasma capsulatum]